MRPAGRGGRTARPFVTFIVVAACVVFTFKELQPSQLFKNTTPAGGDMGAHVWLPAYVKSSLLPHLRITGWTPDWYDGFPALTYYFPGPIVAIALLSYVIPYNIAFKLITRPRAADPADRGLGVRAAGPAALPRPGLPGRWPPCRTSSAGSSPSTAATSPRPWRGSSASRSRLSLALVFLGVVARGLDDGRHRALAAVAAGGRAGCATSCRCSSPSAAPSS